MHLWSRFWINSTVNGRGGGDLKNLHIQVKSGFSNLPP